MSSKRVEPIARQRAEELLSKRGLPCNVDAERFVLGSILLDDSFYIQAAGTLEPDDFSLEKHRRIFKRMGDLNERGERIDRVTVANELMKFGELEACEGMSYLVSLDDGMPQVPKLDGYLRIVRDKADLRRLILMGDELMKAALLEGATPGEIREQHRKRMEETAGRSVGTCTIENIPRVEDCAGAEIRYLYQPVAAAGCITALTGDKGCGKTTFWTWIGGIVSASGVPVLILDRENPLAAVRERLRRLGLQTGPMLQIWGGWRERPAPGPDDPEVIEWVRRCTPKPLLIVDGKLAFFDGDDENDAAQNRAFFQPLRRLADLGAAIGLVAHNGKAESARDFRGSSDFGHAIDAGWAVTNQPRDGGLGTLQLRCFKPYRWALAQDLVYHYIDGGFHLDGDRHAPAKSTAEALTSLLRTNPRVTSEEFEKLAVGNGIPRAMARQFLADGVQESHEVQRERVGKKLLYWLSGEANEVPF